VKSAKSMIEWTKPNQTDATLFINHSIKVTLVNS